MADGLTVGDVIAALSTLDPGLLVATPYLSGYRVCADAPPGETMPEVFDLTQEP